MEYNYSNQIEGDLKMENLTQTQFEYVVYHGKFINMGEKEWYREFDQNKSRLREQGIKTDLAQILLTGRETDLLIIVYDHGKPIANGWARLLKTYTHVDRIFVYPEYRGKKISKKIIQYLLFLRRGLIWNAVHDAMDYVAKKFHGKEGTIEGYRGWILLAANYDGNIAEDIATMKIYRYCSNCKQKIPDGDICPNCGHQFEKKFTDKMFINPSFL